MAASILGEVAVAGAATVVAAADAPKGAAAPIIDLMARSARMGNFILLRLILYECGVFGKIMSVMGNGYLSS